MKNILDIKKLSIQEDDSLPTMIVKLIILGSIIYYVYGRAFGRGSTNYNYNLQQQVKEIQIESPKLDNKLIGNK
jgi:hypothetical protein